MRVQSDSAEVCGLLWGHAADSYSLAANDQLFHSFAHGGRMSSELSHPAELLYIINNNQVVLILTSYFHNIMLAAVWSCMCVHSKQRKGFAVNIEWWGLQVTCCLSLTITQSNIIKCSICLEQSQRKPPVLS